MCLCRLSESHSKPKVSISHGNPGGGRQGESHPTDKAAIEYWAEGYLSGLAAGSHHDVIGQFRREELGAWLDRYCTANPQTPLPLAINALGRAMLAHPGGPL